MPKIVPEPINSLKKPRQDNPNVNPSPIPIPSNIDGNTGFLEAYASALPKIMQLTTIKGIYIPNDVLSAGRYACNNNYKCRHSDFIWNNISK